MGRTYLQTDNICPILNDLLEYFSFSVIPSQGPGRTIAIKLLCAVLFKQNIV